MFKGNVGIFEMLCVVMSILVCVCFAQFNGPA